MIYKPPPLKGLDIKIPIIIPIKGRGLTNQGFGLPSADMWELTNHADTPTSTDPPSKSP